MTALVGHELRSPLAVAAMYLGFARQQLEAGRSASEVSSTLSGIVSELERLNSLVSRVMELEARGRALVQPRLIDLRAVVHDAVADTLATEPGARSNVTIHTGSRRIVGWWDDTAVEEVVRNLLSNALKFGEGRPIRIAVERARKGTRIVVADQGAGLAPRDRARIFERGVRAPPQQGGGLGLGLWLVRALARAHGGRVAVRGGLGRGTVFTVSLPERRPRNPGRAPRGRRRPSPPQEAGAVQKRLADPIVRLRSRPAAFSANRLLIFANDLIRAATFGELLAATREEVKAATGYQHAWFAVADREEADELRLIDFAGDRRDIVWKVAPVLKVSGDRYLESLIASDGPVVIEDARTDSRTDKRIVEQLQNRTLINIPLRLFDKPLGIFGVGTFGDEGCRAPSPKQLDYLSGMALQIAVAVERLRFLEA